MSKEKQESARLKGLICDSLLGSLRKLKKSGGSLNRTVDANSLLQEELQISSLEMISLITDLCDTFSIDITRISDVDLIKMSHVADIADILALKKIESSL